MAKKVVATFQKKGGKGLARVIKAVKSPKTGAYIFQETMVDSDSVKDFIAQKN